MVKIGELGFFRQRHNESINARFPDGTDLESFVVLVDDGGKKIMNDFGDDPYCFVSCSLN
jgi:hypothetical protein